MRYEDIARIFRERPFRPLRVRMVSGTVYDVKTPESIISPRFAAFLLPDGFIANVSLEFIEEIRPLNGRTRRNGSRRKTR